jgi:hypothetical protein
MGPALGLMVGYFRANHATGVSSLTRVNRSLRFFPLIDPVQKFDEPLAIDPKKDFVVLGVVRRELTITALKRYPNFTVNQFRKHTITTGLLIEPIPIDALRCHLNYF